MFNLSKYTQLEQAPSEGLDVAKESTEDLEGQINREGLPDPTTEENPTEELGLNPEQERIKNNLAAKNAWMRMQEIASNAANNGLDPEGVLRSNPDYMRLQEIVNQFNVDSFGLADDELSQLESVAAKDPQYEQVIGQFKREVEELAQLQETIKDQQLMMQQEQQARAAFNLKKHKTAQFNTSDFPVRDAGDLANKFMQRLVTNDPQIYGEAVNEIMNAVGQDQLQETEIDSILEKFWNLDYEDNQEEAAGLFGLMFELLPGHLKAQSELAMANKKPKGIIKFNLSDHIQKDAEKDIKKVGCQGCPMIKTAADQFGQHYLLYGPTEKRICPKLRGKGGGYSGAGDVVSEYICRHHCLDGIVIDDNKTICGEALWRANVMDKFSREYVDADGNITGGYINNRFEINRNVPEENKMRLKPGEIRKPRPAAWGNTESRMQDMRNKEGEKRGYRPNTNTGQPFTWPADADQNNVEVSQTKRDRREKAMGHDTVQYSKKPATENKPKLGFNLKIFKQAQSKNDDEAAKRGDYPSDCCQNCGTPLNEFNQCPKECHKNTKSAQIFEREKFDFGAGESRFREYTDEQLIATLKDLNEVITIQEQTNRDDPYANTPKLGYYHDERHTLLREMNRRGLNPNFEQYSETTPNSKDIKSAQGGSIAPVPEDGAGDRPPFEPKDKNIKQDDHHSRKPAKKAEKWMQDAAEKMEEKGTVGDFTAYCGGEVTEECIERGLAEGGHRAQQANFARNARKAKKTFNLKEYKTAKEKSEATSDSSIKEAVSPPGWSGTVEKMKEHHPEKFDEDATGKSDKMNPFAIAWWMKNKGAEPHYTETGKKKEKFKNEDKDLQKKNE